MSYQLDYARRAGRDAIAKSVDLDVTDDRAVMRQLGRLEVVVAQLLDALDAQDADGIPTAD